MDISEEIENLLETIKILAKDSQEYVRRSKASYPEVSPISIANDVIDVAQINFGDDETWLYKIEDGYNITDITAWLHEDTEPLKDLDFHTKHLTLMREITKLDSAKKIDSRTFTRPKKRFSRPSLDFNESHFKVSEVVNNSTVEKDVDAIAKTVDNNLIEAAPLSFDFSEPANNIFNNVIKGDPDLDSFQNMSPPSLVTSSMFSSLMENSYIKNDPVLREIRDTDYTDVILQGCDPSVLKSLTGSCSSVDSDTPEGFLKRSIETTFIKNDKNVTSDYSAENVLNETFITNNTVLNSTFRKESSGNKSRSFTYLERKGLNSPPNKYNNKSSSILNNTYKKNSNENLNDTFDVVTHNQNEKEVNDDLNCTIIIDENKMDSNRLNYSKRHSYLIEDTRHNLKNNTFSKRNRCSLGSNDSLDCTSSLSNSSSGKGSSKMLNMAEVDAIVLQQEQSLQQVMSTPKPLGKCVNKLSEYTNISPIIQLDRLNHFSDSEASSNDDYITVGSGSSKSITSGNSDSALFVPPKSLNNIKNSISTAINKNVEVPKKQSNLNKQYYGSYTNLHKLRLTAQQGTCKSLTAGNIPRSNATSNLKNMDTKLKSSYTQLKPVLTNLSSATNGEKGFISNVSKIKVTGGSLKIAEVAPIVRDHPKTAPVVNNIKVTSKPSGLPRPVSAIPRPAGSRIPGPQTLRSGIPQSRPTQSRPLNINTDF